MQAFLKEFYSAVFTPEKKHYYEVQMTKFPEVNQFYRTLVKQSNKVSHEDFWQRYEWRCTHVRRIMKQLMLADEEQAAASAAEIAEKEAEETDAKEINEPESKDSIPSPPGSPILTGLRQRFSATTPTTAPAKSGQEDSSPSTPPPSETKPVSLTERFNTFFSPSKEEGISASGGGHSSSTSTKSTRKVPPAEAFTQPEPAEETATTEATSLFSMLFGKGADEDYFEVDQVDVKKELEEMLDKTKNRIKQSILAILVVLVFFRLGQEPAIACAPLPPGSMLSRDLHFSGPRQFEAPWWAPSIFKSEAFLTFCSGRSRTRLDWIPGKPNNDGKMAFDVKMTTIVGANAKGGVRALSKTIVDENSIDSVRVGWDSLEFSRGVTTKKTISPLPWLK
jgi:hypothetical protein